jgi:hypothetical protein
MWRPCQSNNLAPFEPNFFKLFRHRTGLANIFEDTCPNFRIFFLKHSFMCGNPSLPTPYNPSLPTPYNPLFLWRLSVPYSLGPRATALLARTKSGPILNHLYWTLSKYLSKCIWALLVPLNNCVKCTTLLNAPSEYARLCKSLTTLENNEKKHTSCCNLQHLRLRTLSLLT